MADDLTPGTDVGGFVLGEVAGRGGMSVLYQATETALGRTVAVKVMAPQLSVDEAFRERFVAEARLASGLGHPHVIPVYAFGEYAGRMWMAMRFVPDSTDLRKLLRSSGPLDPPLAIDILGQLAEAVDSVHRSGMVHRDIKPDNALLAFPDEHDDTPFVYLTDFGLVRAQVGRRLTQAGQVVGTIAYASPEQIRGREIDSRADVYSFAVLVFECLTGQRPFVSDGGEAALMFAHLSAEPPPATSIRSALPNAVDEVLARGMSKDPDGRYRVCTQLVRALAAALDVPTEVSVPGPAALADIARRTVIAPADDPVATEPAGSAAVADVAATRVRPAPSGGAASAVTAQSPLGQTDPEVATRAATPPALPAAGPATTAPSADGVGVAAAGPSAVEQSAVTVFATASGAPPVGSTPRRAPVRSRRLPVVAALGVVALVLVVLLVWRGRGTQADEGVLQLPSVTAANGVRIDRAWRLPPADTAFHGETALVNPTDEAVPFVHDEVLPKSLAADVSQVSFDPAPTQVIQADPVVRYRLDIAPRSTVTIAYDVTVAATDDVDGRLTKLVDDKRRAEREYAKTPDAQASDTPVLPDDVAELATGTTAAGGRTSTTTTVEVTDTTGGPPDSGSTSTSTVPARPSTTTTPPQDPPTTPQTAPGAPTTTTTVPAPAPAPTNPSVTTTTTRPPPSPPPPPPTSTSVPLGGGEQQVLNLVNSLRAQQSLPQLAPSSSLNAAAASANAQVQRGEPVPNLGTAYSVVSLEGGSVSDAWNRRSLGESNTLRNTARRYFGVDVRTSGGQTWVMIVLGTNAS